MDLLDKVRGQKIGADLTQRERVVLANLSEERTLEEIVGRLFATRNTVKSPVRSVYRKLGVSTPTTIFGPKEAGGIDENFGSCGSNCR